MLNQLLSTIDDWVKSRNASVPTDVVFLDLAKAFDSVPHERLLLKLKKDGINGCLLNWLLSNRSLVTSGTKEN